MLLVNFKQIITSAEKIFEKAAILGCCHGHIHTATSLFTRLGFAFSRVVASQVFQKQTTQFENMNCPDRALTTSMSD